MPGDYNPDKEAHAEHRFIVQDATTRRLDHVPNAPALKLNPQGRCILHDVGLAREIQSSTKEVTVTRMRTDRSDRGHVYFFGQSLALPWARYDELGRRLPDEEEDDGNSS